MILQLYSNIAFRQTEQTELFKIRWKKGKITNETNQDLYFFFIEWRPRIVTIHQIAGNKKKESRRNNTIDVFNTIQSNRHPETAIIEQLHALQRHVAFWVTQTCLISRNVWTFLGCDSKCYRVNYIKTETILADIYTKQKATILWARFTRCLKYFSSNLWWKCGCLQHHGQNLLNKIIYLLETSLKFVHTNSCFIYLCLSFGCLVKVWTWLSIHPNTARSFNSTTLYSVLLCGKIQVAVSAEMVGFSPCQVGVAFSVSVWMHCWREEHENCIACTLVLYIRRCT